MASDVGGWARMGDALRFVIRPTFAARPMAWGRGAVLALLAVFALDLMLDGLAAWLIGLGDAQANFLPDPVDLDISLAEDLFASLLLAPVLEELLFRGWLGGKAASLRFALYGFVALALFLVSLAVPAAATAIALAAVITVFAGIIHWGRARHRDTAVPAWFIRHFRWMVWGSALVSGLTHLGNYEPLTHPLGLLVVAPQTIGGLLLAYARTRIGLGAAIAHHAAYNAVFMAGDYGWW